MSAAAEQPLPSPGDPPAAGRGRTPLKASLFTVFVYCPLAHATWHPNGLLRRFGVLDFAGGTVVHMSAGIAALVGALFLGRRTGHGPGHAHVPAHIPFVLLGTGMLWFGWFGFNAGSALAASPLAVHAFLTTNTASAAAMLSWICLERLQGRPASALGACIGAVVGLVAITPAAGFVSVLSPVGQALLGLQIGELLSFEQTRLPSGLWRYAAAGNGHDDMVMALALLARGHFILGGGVFFLAKSDPRALAQGPSRRKSREGRPQQAAQQDRQVRARARRVRAGADPGARRQA